MRHTHDLSSAFVQRHRLQLVPDSLWLCALQLPAVACTVSAWVVVLHTFSNLCPCVPLDQGRNPHGACILLTTAPAVFAVLSTATL
jgi:hypothetical protein